MARKQRRLKCYGFYCYKNGFKHDRNYLTKYNGKNYCNRCLKRFKFQNKYRTKLYHYIEDEFKIQFPTGHMLAQIKDYVDNRNYTYFGILQSLEYMQKVQDKELGKMLTLGYVPYVYENARDWWLVSQKNGGNMSKPNTKELGETINDRIEKVQTKNVKKEKKLKKQDMNNILD